MKADYLLKILEVSQKTFRCLRSGACCTSYDVMGVPGYNQSGRWTGNMKEKGLKRGSHMCHHLEPAEIVDGKWKQATCKIHDHPDYPEECRQFVMGFGNCMLGNAVWKHRKGDNPDVELPDGIEAK